MGGKGHRLYACAAERSRIATACGIDDFVDFFTGFRDGFLYHFYQTAIEFGELPRIGFDRGKVSGIGNRIDVQNVGVILIHFRLVRFDVRQRAFQPRFFGGKADVYQFHAFGQFFGMFLEILHHHHVQGDTAEVIHGAGRSFGLVLGQVVADKEESRQECYRQNVCNDRYRPRIVEHVEPVQHGNQTEDDHGDCAEDTVSRLYDRGRGILCGKFPTPAGIIVRA